ncbi:MAG: hypothetical protein A2Z91_05170 [Deltaproteobacteria bacterium GWA2_38_16]|nr:MAG: hypothetical protein A2Z91_05170 [Deltaproteobacteria bacterium GWA2_38_16]OGQ03170.1 MAG: hypothetical protein A3D19_03900 [Deltaproteobacteria bacterium RIFCSPHIGHO2_02_FULL_38_15]OGQ33765.1 MAG: hypothetical protein A3A72_06355 [Deltaproteobacteria bacterium RIFCSPLOWO2_01_FULL_38_9]HBQ20406.1 hypothetical protein [Deltaproteobacteria bacterium]
MKWEAFYAKFSACSIITPQMVYACGGHDTSLQVQMSRWVKSGKLIKLARERYVFSALYQKDTFSEVYIANHLVYPSYVSLEYALSFFGLIPEAVYSVTSVTSLRPIKYQTKAGNFTYRHLKKEMFWGYESQSEGMKEAMIACPEKAILDTFYFWRGEISQARVDEMRFQNLDQINVDKLLQFTEKTKNSKLSKIIHHFLLPLIHEEKKAA